jgi:NAD(P)-dependent dehydrogenase (short-subunit alcohol dehydrogenase family)
MAWTTENIPSLAGRVALVTGANSGLGLETARALAGAGAHVILAARTAERASAARAGILATFPKASLEPLAMDLASQASVKAAARAVARNHPALDILVNNAGVMALPESRTEDGYETQLGVDHLGHWTLTALLLPSLLNADAARVVTVSSMARHQGRALDPKDPYHEGAYDPWRAYGDAKLANYHFAIGLQREFERHGARASSLAAHPGLSHTNLQVATDERGGAGPSGARWRVIAERRGMTSARGALPQLRAATDPRARGGQFYGPRFLATGAAVRRPILRRIGLGHAIRTLWAVSERETGVALAFGSAAGSVAGSATESATESAGR